MINQWLINDNQWLIIDNQWLINDNQWQSLINQWQSMTINDNQWQSMINQWLSMIINKSCHSSINDCHWLIIDWSLIKKKLNFFTKKFSSKNFFHFFFWCLLRNFLWYTLYLLLSPYTKLLFIFTCFLSKQKCIG